LSTKVLGLCLAVGIVGWATCTVPWQLFCRMRAERGWLGRHERRRGQWHRLAVVPPLPPAALGMAYNGGSIGGVIFSPLWVATIAVLGFAKAAVLVGLVMVVAMWVLADRLFPRTPKRDGIGARW